MNAGHERAGVAPCQPSRRSCTAAGWPASRSSEHRSANSPQKKNQNADRVAGRAAPGGGRSTASRCHVGDPFGMRRGRLRSGKSAAILLAGTRHSRRILIPACCAAGGYHVACGRRARHLPGPRPRSPPPCSAHSLPSPPLRGRRRGAPPPSRPTLPARQPRPTRRPPRRPSAPSTARTRSSTPSSPRTPRSKCSPAASSGPKGRSGTRRTAHLLFSDIPNNRVVKWSAKDGVKRLPQAERLHRQRAEFTGAEPGSNGLRLRQGRPPRPLPARRPPRRPAGEGRQVVRDARRQVHGQAAQQPQRPRVRQERRPVLHRPALRPARGR